MLMIRRAADVVYSSVRRAVQVTHEDEAGFSLWPQPSDATYTLKYEGKTWSERENIMVK